MLLNMSFGREAVLQYYFSCGKIAHSALRHLTFHQHFSQMISKNKLKDKKLCLGGYRQ